MNEIKIPVSWIKKKGIVLSGRDLCCDNSGFLSSWDHIKYNHNSWCVTAFADRKNTGKQPVDDWVPVCWDAGFFRGTSLANIRLDWSLLKSWKPNIEALYKIYLAEQHGENEYIFSKTELTDAIEDIKASEEFDWSKAPEWATMYGEMKGRSIVKCYANDGFFTPYSDPWNTFEKHEFGVDGNWNKEDFTCLQKRSPIYTKEMHDTGELPPVGWVGEVCTDLSSMISTLRHWKVGDHIKCVVHVKNSSGGDTPVFQHLDLTTVSGLLLECFKPIETKTDEQKAYESFMLNKYVSGSPKEIIFHAGVEFARKQADLNKITGN